MQLLWILLILSCYCGTYASQKETEDIDPSRTVLWGPGLNPQKVTMRARYFFLQLYDSEGKNVTKSPGKGVISVQIKGQMEHGPACHIWTQLLDCNDGSFIIRYKLFNTCYDLSINVRVKNLQTGLDTTVLDVATGDTDPVFDDDCDCPNPSVVDWLNNYECSESYDQIDDDLESFPTIDFDKIRDHIIIDYNKPNSVSICHYVIKNNKIYRQCYGKHVGFKTFADSILLSLARKVVLPDTEFFMNLGDWPLVPNHKLYPIFSWCGSEDSRDIVVPTYDLTESSLENMGRVMLDMLSVQGNIKVPWDEKIEKLFWRGRDSRRERLDLIGIARKNPELFNASITNFFFFKDLVEEYGPGERHVSFFNFFQYKYQLNIDGTVAAYRFPYLLAGDSLVFKQKSEYYEYFYRHVVPEIHYVPVKHDLSDLVGRIEWAKQNDDEARKISKAARYLMRDVAMPRDVFCYYVSLLREWSKRVKSKIAILKGMEEVPQPEHFCECDRFDDTDSTKLKNEL